jgi:hypothetical protein
MGRLEGLNGDIKGMRGLLFVDKDKIINLMKELTRYIKFVNIANRLQALLWGT